MRRSALSLGGWLAAVCSVASVAWACSSSDTNPFGNGSRRGQGGSSGTDTGGGGTSGTSSGTDSGGSGGSSTGGTSGSSTGGDATGGMTTGGGTGEGGAAAEAGNDTGGTTTGGATTGGATTGGAAGAGMGGNGGAGAGAGGAGAGGTSAGAGAGGAGAGAGAGMGGAGMSGSGGMPGECKVDTDCDDDEYCKKASCNAESGHCTARGPECRGDDATFDPVCGCDGITYWNTCAIEHEGFNVAMAGECTGNNRPTCTRAAGGDSCPTRLHVHCYRSVDMCNGTSPTMGVCWVLPTECPPNEPQTQRYCGGTAGDARCIGLCEVIDAENTVRRDAPQCN